MNTTPTLEEHAREFAVRLSRILSTFTGTECAVLTSMADGHAIVKLDPSAGTPGGIPLRAAGRELLTMKIHFHCAWDVTQTYLSVEKSSIIVGVPGRLSREPLFRYDYVRHPDSGIPCSHLQVHAHRDAFTHILGHAGAGSSRSRERVTSPLTKTPKLSEFHFPIGGPRFRPTLEDVLEVLQDEFRLDTGPGWSDARDEARREWRKTQVAAAVRDASETAAETLRSLGYTVDGSPQPDRDEHLLRL